MLWTCLVLTAAYCLFVYIFQYQDIQKNGRSVSLDPLFFNFVIYMGILTAVLTSLFVGTEYHDGTIRNKIISGASRTNIYLSNCLLCTFMGTVILLIGCFIGFALGIPLFGNFEMTTASLIFACLSCLLATWAYASIFTMITMINSSKTTAAVISLLLAFGLLFASLAILAALSQPEYIQQLVTPDNTVSIVTSENADFEFEWVKNPNYLTGIKRKIYQNILDFLPTGQTMQIVDQGGLETNLPMMLFYSIYIIIGTNVIGILTFNKKNIK